MGRKYICLKCKLEFDNLKPDIVDGTEAYPCCPGCGCEAVTLAVPCPICGETMPDGWAMCDFCEADIRDRIESMFKLHKVKNRRLALSAVIDVVFNMAHGNEVKRPWL